MAASRPGAGRPTMADVAAAAGVSTALVSIVFRDVPGASEATRERVRRAAAEIGYIPDRHAQKLRQARSGLIGVTFELQQPFHGDLVERLYPAVVAQGWDLVLSGVAPTRDEQTAVDALVRERCEAVILLGSRLSTIELDDLARRVPVQVVARASGTDAVGSVRMDDAQGIALAVDHLAGLGHRRIVYIDGAGAPGNADRVSGFRRRTAELGLDGRVMVGGATESDGVAAMTAILDADDAATAVMAFNDRVAIGVLDVLVRRGIAVPEDISVMGYDDSRLSRLAHIGLTTVAQDTDLLAGEVVAQVVRQLAGGEPAEIVLAPRLVVRRTTGTAPNPNRPM